MTNANYAFKAAPIHKSTRKTPAKLALFLSFLLPIVLFAQAPAQGGLLKEVTLQDAIAYAIKQQPIVQQSQLDEQITDAQIRSKLADWYPQVNFNYNLQHNFLVQSAFVGGNTVKLGTNNTSSLQFTASQTIFNRDVLLAKRTKTEVAKLSRQYTAEDKINLTVDVSKAFYDVLSTLQQIKVASSNITRIERSLKDAFNQYNAGIADKIDYKRATIALNNAKASRKGNEDILAAKLAYLKSLMNYPDTAELNIAYDSLQMENEIALDTLQQLNYKSRIEFAQLETQRQLLVSNIEYTKWSYLPSVSAFGAYNLNFLNNDFSELYSKNFPTAYAGLTIGVPIYQGGKRKENNLIAALQLQRNEQDMAYFENVVNAQYAQALAIYKSNLTNYLTLKENMQLAEEVYDVLQLQYRSGIKTYLEVITSETDLRTAQINYYNAVYELLASKIDVQKTLGQINY
ncbi:MAG: TolC family protein [Bacteroidetes bacterium]|nr:TolC family protein [Bacteroidota bacterium]